MYLYQYFRFLHRSDEASFILQNICVFKTIYIYIYMKLVREQSLEASPENVVSYLFYSAVIDSGKKFSRLHFYISSKACFHFSIFERYTTYKSQYLFFCHNICILKLNERIKLFFFISKNRSYYYKSLATGLCLLQIQRSRYIHALLNCE